MPTSSARLRVGTSQQVRAASRALTSSVSAIRPVQARGLPAVTNAETGTVRTTCACMYISTRTHRTTPHRTEGESRPDCLAQPIRRCRASTEESQGRCDGARTVREEEHPLAFQLAAYGFGIGCRLRPGHRKPVMCESWMARHAQSQDTMRFLIVVLTLSTTTYVRGKKVESSTTQTCSLQRQGK